MNLFKAIFDFSKEQKFVYICRELTWQNVVMWRCVYTPHGGVCARKCVRKCTRVCTCVRESD